MNPFPNPCMITDRASLSRFSTCNSRGYEFIIVLVMLCLEDGVSQPSLSLNTYILPSPLLQCSLSLRRGGIIDFLRARPSAVAYTQHPRHSLPYTAERIFSSQGKKQHLLGPVCSYSSGTEQFECLISFQFVCVRVAMSVCTWRCTVPAYMCV